jgi:endonuclease/exonuclease/phosphatase family metal-dependent hydrolase
MKNKTCFLVMILLLSSFLLFAQIPQAKSGTMVVATWNMKDFGTKSRDDIELTQVCQVLKSFDLVVMQEVFGEEVLSRTASIMKDRFGLSYKYLLSAPEGGNRESYAFFFKEDLVEALSMPTIEHDSVFKRPPCYLLVKAGGFDFYVIDIHMSTRDDSKDQTAEANELAAIYDRLQSQDGEDDLLLLGDFNLAPTDKKLASLRAIPSIGFVDETRKTTLRNSFDDNIWLQGRFTSQYKGEWGILDFSQEYFDGNRDAAMRAVSDHLPVWARFDLAVADTSHR